MNTQALSTTMGLILQFANIIILMYALYRFLNKPHDTLEERVDILEKRLDEDDVKFKEIGESLHHGNDKFRRQDDLNEVFINCMLAFIDFEMAYCQHTGYDDTSDLDNAKDTLRKYLAKR